MGGGIDLSKLSDSQSIAFAEAMKALKTPFVEQIGVAAIKGGFDVMGNVLSENQKQSNALEQLDRQRKIQFSFSPEQKQMQRQLLGTFNSQPLQQSSFNPQSSDLTQRISDLRARLGR